MIKYLGTISENEVILRNIEYLTNKNHKYTSELLPDAIKKILFGIEAVTMAEKLLPEIENDRIKKDLEKILFSEKESLIDHVTVLLNYEYTRSGHNLSNCKLIYLE
ncbi:conserved hypothetical protein [Methanococcus vannielii SB]|uniref:Uncharacterized protein n=1 Tax=Methanococcus vannielii (strain ATCC 35089 / DSM 1224 / JCM 13029 / OCM 148 / SB) TaxID=406327 RepID=A6USM5_METVS|nr:hypothetical protein [Methanococcus vannielii]ABR55497.1 conserved hypothetical protein [Methanococcus vannielii SB]